MVIGEDDAQDDRARLRVPLAGSLSETGDPFEPYRLVNGGGQPLVPVTEFLRTLQAAGRSEATQRSYGMDLLRWFRFTWAAGFAWDQATRAEARDFCRWLYDYHLEAGTGPLANPFPLARMGRRANAHHNPLEPFRQERAGLFRPA